MRSAGTMRSLWLTTATPMRSSCRTNSPCGSCTRKPGIDSSLSTVPPVCPSPRPDILPKTAPLVAACGAVFGKMSGRGLGHTGGTVDKLESIPGFRVQLPQGEFVRQLERIGVAVVSQSERIVPADRILYALRDVTATIECDGLIAASIMAKKVASGTAALVLDVKVGRGAFMGDLAHARNLGRLCRLIGAAYDRPTTCIFTSMESPLGRTVGNRLEVEEAWQVPVSYTHLTLPTIYSV